MRLCEKTSHGPIYHDLYVVDVHKYSIDIATADCGRDGGVRHVGKIRWTDKALANFKHRGQTHGRSWGISMEHRLQKLEQYVGVDGVLRGISQHYRPVPELDDWIRRRIRMCYWKQWRWPRTKILHLLDLGVSLKTAIQHGVSSKSYWPWRELRRCSRHCPTRG